LPSWLVWGVFATDDADSSTGVALLNCESTVYNTKLRQCAEGEVTVDYYVKELADKRAVLVAEDGYTLGEFPSVSVAYLTCCEECHAKPSYVEHYYSYLDGTSDKMESTYM